MDETTVNTIINAGTGAILLFLYMRLEARFDALQKQLHETNMRMWELLQRLAINDDASASDVRRYMPPPAEPK